MSSRLINHKNSVDRFLNNTFGLCSTVYESTRSTFQHPPIDCVDSSKVTLCVSLNNHEDVKPDGPPPITITFDGILIYLLFFICKQQGDDYTEDLSGLTFFACVEQIINPTHLIRIRIMYT